MTTAIETPRRAPRRLSPKVRRAVLTTHIVASGGLLGAGTKWGVLRHRRVAGKLLLLLSVIVVGSLATGLSVFKPGGRLRR